MASKNGFSEVRDIQPVLTYNMPQGEFLKVFLVGTSLDGSRDQFAIGCFGK